jgi:hypothetical protein
LSENKVLKGSSIRLNTPFSIRYSTAGINRPLSTRQAFYFRATLERTKDQNCICMKFRRAKIEDAARFVEIKEQLPMPVLGEGENNTGGFLLATSENMYIYFINHAFCLVAEVDDCVVGFGILLPDDILKMSEIWDKRYLVNWKLDIDDYEYSKLCYFEQLAFLPPFRKLAPVLAFTLLHDAFQNECYDAMFTSTVQKPVTNLAAVPLIKAAGGKLIGNINEYYLGAGEINSDIYIIEKEDFNACLQKLNLAKRVQSPMAHPL